MPDRESLRTADVRAAYRLVNECRELGASPSAWRDHLLAGLSALAGAPLVTGAEAGAVAADGRVAVRRILGVGWPSETAAAAWHRHVETAQQNRDPVVCQLAATGLRLGTFRRHDALADAAWYRSNVYAELCRVANVDHPLMSVEPSPGGAEFLVLLRPERERPFGDRARRLVRLVHSAYAPMVGESLARVDERDPAGLAPRPRQALDLLLQGLTDKAIAQAMGIGVATAHQYVLTCLRHFEVRSRPALLALFLRRAGVRLPPVPRSGDRPSSAAGLE